MSRTVYVVPHCHWDREWYQPHELFRWRLVQMIDELLDYMEAHREYRCFNLDGQSIVIEDYLQLRPENEGRLRALIQAGRIVIGPWWVQPDEFLPSGESHIRSFQKGIRFAERLGGSLRVGHCADQFGHIAQMPQIMKQLQLTSACLWRGVSDAVPGWSFWWEAPDGTRLPVLYLRNSYSSGWRLPNEPDDLLERIRRQERDLADGLPAVLMNGTDHSRMEKHVPAALASAKDRGYDFKLATLEEYEKAVLAAGVDEVVHRGEMRSPDRSNVLVGVLSARMNIKQRDFEVSSWLEKYAEPLELLSYLHHGPDGTPALRHAWRTLLENSPHDSICGCSVDQTHLEMFPRFDRAEQLAMQVAKESMWHIAGRANVPAPGGLSVLRPVANAATVLQADVPLEWANSGGLQLPVGSRVPFAVESETPVEVLLHQADLTPWAALRHLDFLREQRYDEQNIESMEWELEGRHLKVTTIVGPDLTVVDEETIRHEVRQIATNNLADTAEITVQKSARAEITAVLPATESVGVQMLAPSNSVEISSPATETPPLPRSRERGPGGEGHIANEHYEIWLDKKGRLRIRDWQNGIDLKNACAFVSEGDRGDEYNADILPDGVSVPISVDLLAVEENAVSSSLRFASVYEVPYELNRKRTGRTKRDHTLLPLVTTVTLYRGLNRVDFRVTLDNNARDHRIRALFPLPFATETAITENQFHVAERSLTPPPWNGVSPEQPPTTFPQKTFAAFETDGMGVAVFNKGLQEGEVVNDKRGRQAYALTLLRCVGWLSRPDLVSRRGGAGPTISTEDSQMQGTHTFEFSLTTYRGGWRENNVQAMAHSFAFPPIAWATNEHEGSLGSDVPLAKVSPGVVPTAFTRSDLDGAPIIRAYNASGTETEAAVFVPSAVPGAGLVDLMEEHTHNVVTTHGDWRFPLRPWEFASVRFGRRE
ncbi:MAG: glycoside hydrolase family 38 C-terminal domain-containing protein [Dehalococcoidia bacterium]